MVRQVLQEQVELREQMVRVVLRELREQQVRRVRRV